MECVRPEETNWLLHSLNTYWQIISFWQADIRCQPFLLGGLLMEYQLELKQIVDFAKQFAGM